MAFGAVRVGWIFSLARSGSSVAAYAAASPWGHAVADEIFGPWDRTVPPYNYPPEQVALMNAFKGSGDQLTWEVISLANGIFATLGERTGAVVCKHPHWVISPAEFRTAFPGHGAAYLVRNPLHRLNSLFVRGWHESLGPRYGYIAYKMLIERFRGEPGKVVYDDLRHNPAKFFSQLYRAWGWDHDDSHVEAAARYSRENYHGESGEITPEHSPERVLSEQRMALPDEVIELYLSDEEIRSFMREMGWSVDPEDYRAERGADVAEQA